MALVIRDWITGNQNLEEDLELMRNKADSLFARAADISTQVRNEELNPGKKRKREVDNWMRNAKKLKNRIEGVEAEVEEGVPSNHRRLRDQIRNITKEMGDLLEQANRHTFHNGLTIHDLASSSLPLVITEMKGQQFEKNMRMILSWLMNDDISKIGVYGAGGIGKTTLATHIHDQLLGKSASIYWVTVSENCTMLQLQHKIAKELNLSADILEKEDEMRRPAILSEAFQKRSNAVVILDDMWESVPMEKIGVPVGKNQCKLLLTTRSYDVCRKMACQESVKVQVLSEEESLSFFAETLGNYDDLSDELKDIAKLVAKECAGLPLGIKVVATSMRGVFDVSEWNNTLEELKNPTRIHKGLEDEVLCSLLVSYSRLNDEKLKNCLLSCALYPEDCMFERDELVNLWIMEGHLEELPSRREKLNMAHAMLNRLIGACLLDTKLWIGRDFVKMHDLIRDMAIHISRQSHQTMIKAGMQLQEVPRLQEWTEDLTKVSLVRNKIREIPIGMSPRCPNLSSLLLHDNPLETIPDPLFQFFSSLKFLDLSGTNIERVPESVSYLENLSSLKVSYCRSLTYVPSLEKLTKLRHLDLSSCGMLKVLPQGIDKLANLESLLLEGCYSWLRVPFRELTTGLSNIQCLELSDGVEYADATDIQKLRCLERLMDCRMRDTSNFNTYVQSQNFHQLTSYRLHLGLTPDSDFFEEFQYDRSVIVDCMALEGGTEQAQLPHKIQALMVLHNKFDVRSLVDDLPLSNSWSMLIRLDMWYCKRIRYVWAESSCSKSALENLEELKIQCSRLKGLAEGRATVPLGAFRNLKSLCMEDCSKVEKLFTPCLLNGQLGNLEEIAIANCERLVEIFAGSELDEDANIELPKLRRLSLQNLPGLVSICKSGLQVCCKSIENIEVMKCPKLTKLPLFHQLLGNEVPSSPPPHLRKIVAEEEWWESLVWDHPCTKQNLQPFLFKNEWRELYSGYVDLDTDSEDDFDLYYDSILNDD